MTLWNSHGGQLTFTPEAWNLRGKVYMGVSGNGDWDMWDIDGMVYFCERKSYACIQQG